MTDAPALDNLAHLVFYVVFWAAVLSGAAIIAFLLWRRFFR